MVSHVKGTALRNYRDDDGPCPQRAYNLRIKMETCETYAMQGKTGAVITETNIKTYHKAVCD